MERSDLITLIEETRDAIPAAFGLQEEDLAYFTKLAEAEPAKAFEEMYLFGMSQGAAAERSVHCRLAEKLAGMSVADIDRMLRD